MVLSLPAAEVQRLTGRSLKTIGVRRVRLKRMGFKVTDQRASDWRTKVGRSRWTPDADELVRQLHPREVAKRLGVSESAAVRRRAALGLPPIPRRRKPPRTTPKRIIRKWTADEIEIALALPPVEAQKRLRGRTLSAIHTLRCLRKRRGRQFKGYRPGRKRGQR